MLFRKPAGAVSFLIVGLGNPGVQYENTRHNAGYLALNALADKLSVKLERFQFKANTVTADIDGKKVLLMFPQTFMNLSGEAVQAAMAYYKLTPAQLLVFSDDISLPVGAVRIRRKGSDGGQRGLRNIIDLIGSEDFCRIKIGVGAKPHPDYDLKDWVLSRFTKEETVHMNQAWDNAAEAAMLIAGGDIDSAMNRYSK